MPKFRIFKNIENKVRKSTAQTIRKAAKRSIEWYKKNIEKNFGKKRASKAQWEKPAKQPRKPTNVGSRKINKNLRQNTTLDKTFKKNVKQVSRPLIGHMYFYIYDPKWKKVLPYYDVFPLVFPIEYYPDGFLGLNLHYLPYILRAKLLDALFSLEKTTMVAGKEQKYLQISYGILKSMSNNPYYKPTIKRYLYHHVRSPFAEVLSDEWENAAFLPVEQFRKANKREVWVDSKAMVQ